MLFLGTDLSLKYIVAEIDKEKVTIAFRSNLCKGIYDVSIYKPGKGYVPIKIKSAYPGLVQVIREIALLIRVHLKNLIDSISKRCG